MKTLPDYVRKGMKVVIVGCNPSVPSVRAGHYYSGRGNQFWTLLYDSGVIPEPLESRDDKRVLEFGVGLTDLVKRPTKGIEELEREDFSAGRVLLSRKIEELAPRIVAFHGKMTYEYFTQRRCKLGAQKELLYGAHLFVLPSSSGANAVGRTAKLKVFRELAKLMRKGEKT